VIPSGGPLSAAFLALLLIATSLPGQQGGDREAAGRSEMPGEAALRVEIVGADGLGSVALRSALAPWLEDLIAAPDDPGVREDLIFELAAAYRKRGYLEASGALESTGEPGEAGRRLLLRVEEGPRAFLDRVIATGNRAFGSDLLEGAFPWLRPGLLPGGRRVFTESARDAGVAAIRLLYSLEGYLDTKIVVREDRQEIPSPPGASPAAGAIPSRGEILVRLVVEIDEGPRTTLEQIEVLPGSELPDATLLALAGVTVGGPVTPRLPLEVRSRLRRALQDRGHYQAEVTVELDSIGEARRRLRIRVREGEIHTFGEVRIIGDARTRRSFLRDRFGIEPGERYSTRKLEEGQRSLNATGLLSRFTVDLVPTPEDPLRLDVEVALEERDTVRLDARLGFSTYELGRLGVGVLHRNLLGSGIEGRLEGLASFKGEQAEARLRIPYLLGEEITIELRGRYRRFEEVSFERRERLGTVLLDFPVDRRLSINTGFEARDEDISQVDPVDVELDESSRAHLLFVGARHDDRDSPISTTRGLLFGGRVELSTAALGSDLDFTRLTLHGSHTAPLGGRWGIVLAAQTGLIDRTDAGEIPLGERFFLGGPRSVRSFRQDRMGPRDAAGKEIGGEAFAVGSVEIRTRLVGTLSLATFLDGGSLVEDVEDYAEENWRFGAGLGLIWNSPVGPLRVDAAATLNPGDGDDEWAIHVLLGQPF
jgi:outer membrane protein assembly complex protein YaeT